MPDHPWPDGPHVEYHAVGSVRARGTVAGGHPDGYWEWFRLDGTLMRSGHYAEGREVGEWTTYDRSGAVYQVTDRG